MNTRFLLCTTGSLLLPLFPALAGERSGGTGAGAVRIPADTLSGGGGSSSGGTGAGAVTMTSSMGGIIGTATVASPAVTNQQGYIPQILPAATTPLTGFDLWASTNIPAGRDRTFAGDWNGDGIVNGVAYVFGNTPFSLVRAGRIPLPPPIPPDVNVFLDRTITLNSWTTRVSWVDGAAPSFGSNFSIVGNEVVDGLSAPEGKVFYRYRVVKR